MLQIHSPPALPSPFALKKQVATIFIKSVADRASSVYFDASSCNVSSYWQAIMSKAPYEHFHFVWNFGLPDFRPFETFSGCQIRR